MKYFIGDIVEIVTHKYKSYQDIPRHEVMRYENLEEPAPFIGQRFRIDGMDDKYGIVWMYYINRIGNECICCMINTNYIRLYKRSIRNRIKSIFYR